MRYFLRFFVALSLSWLAYTRTDGFAPWKIEAPLPSTESRVASDEVKKILQEPFSYLGKGRQCFVFVSSDQRYVLKFFNKTYFQMPWFSFLCHKKEKAKRDKRRIFFEKSYEIAFKEFGEKIVHLHLAPSSDLFSKEIEGPAHQTFKIDLNQTPFILQKRGDPFYASLQRIYEQEGMQGLYREIDAFILQVSKRISRQIADGDSDVENNWGYVDGEIFHLDPGRLYFDPSLKSAARQKAEWHTATHLFIKWLKCNYPEASQYFEDQLFDKFISDNYDLCYCSYNDVSYSI